MGAARLHCLPTQNDRIVGARQQEHVGRTVLPRQMAALYEDRTGSRARDDASGLHHGVQTLGRGVDAGQDTRLGDVGSHDLCQAEQLVHHGPRRPVSHERRPARGDHDRVDNDAACPMAAQALRNCAGDPGA